MIPICSSGLWSLQAGAVNEATLNHIALQIAADIIAWLSYTYTGTPQPPHTHNNPNNITSFLEIRMRNRTINSR
jgi:hypothetical protein